MARRTWEQLRTAFADNNEGAISAQDMRNLVDSVSGHTAPGAPGPNNDSSQGFSPGSLWLDTTEPALWVCVSNTVGAAVWTPAGGGGGVATRVEEIVASSGASGAAHAFDLSAATLFRLTLTAACAVTFANVPAGGFGITLELTQDATGSRLVTWPGNVTWAGGTPPTLSTTPNAVDVITMYTPDGGTTWRGALVGLSFS